MPRQAVPYCLGFGLKALKSACWQSQWGKIVASGGPNPLYALDLGVMFAIYGADENSMEKVI